MPQPLPESLAFDDIVMDFAGRRLWRGGVEQALEPKAFAVLVLLASSPARAFTREEILDAVWGHRHVTPSVLNRTMSLLRQALGEDAQRPRLLHTLHGIGYRFEMPGTGPKPDAGGAGMADSPDAPPPGGRPAADGPLQSGKRWIWLAVAASAVLATLAAPWLSRHGEPASESVATEGSGTPRASLAVLPFADLSQSHDQEFFADGLAEQILDQLAQVPALRVVGRSSSFAFKGRTEDLRAIGRQLGVAHLLEGSVSKAGDQLRVTAQLIRADDGTQLWSKTYGAELRDVFVVQEQISRDVARALSVKLDLVTFNREQGGTTNVEAYERLLRWRNIVMLEQFDAAHDRERLQLAREMVALDPSCVLCRDALAGSLNAMAQEVGGVQGERLRAESLEVRNAIARMAPASWVARRDRSNALWREGRRAEAIALAKQIVDSGPLTKERVWDYAYMIYAMGHLNETVALVEQVRALEPMALFLSRDLQYDYTAARRYDDAEAEYQRGLKLTGSQLEPTYVAFFRQLAGKRQGGIAELRGLHRQLLQLDSGMHTPFFRDLYPVLGDREAMLVLVRKALADPAYGGGIQRAYVWTNVADALGDAALAAAGLRMDMEAREGFREHTMAQFPFVAFWNLPYSAVRAHPEFKKLLVEAGIADYWRQTGNWGDGCTPVGQDFKCL